jgi:hypothetical protein
MASGHLPYHILATWISVALPNGTMEYYAVNAAGTLMLDQGRLIPHHNCQPQDGKTSFRPHQEIINNPSSIWSSQSNQT